MSKKRLLVLYFCIGAGVVAWTQEVLPPDLTESVQDEAGEWDLDELGTLPLDINRIRLDQLRRLGILTPQQQQAFLNYREEYGPFLSLYELQAVPGWDPELINRILPYLSCGEPGLANEGEA
ncbi:MAG: helix-hairpin-helix domain-containing protein, partial [Saprospiraceae bacterium]|nr:helix-hairpin-helix domain-containing protein [Saprospiraceae bacterium]